MHRQEGGHSTTITPCHRNPISVDEATAARALRDVLLLARAERLTTYDAAYLELAMRRGLPLATKDEALVVAAGRVGVEVKLP